MSFLNGVLVSRQVAQQSVYTFATLWLAGVYGKHFSHAWLRVFPASKQVLQRWTEFLMQNGRFVLIEGYWITGAGLHAKEITEILPSSCINVSVQNLSDNPNFWGGNITEEEVFLSWKYLFFFFKRWHYIDIASYTLTLVIMGQPLAIFSASSRFFALITV